MYLRELDIQLLNKLSSSNLELLPGILFFVAFVLWGPPALRQPQAHIIQGFWALRPWNRQGPLPARKPKKPSLQNLETLEA